MSWVRFVDNGKLLITNIKLPRFVNGFTVYGLVDFRKLN